MPAARGHDHRPVHLRAPLRHPVREISVAARLARPGCSAELFETTASAAAARWLGLPTWPGHRTVGVPAISRLPAPAGPPDEPSAPPRAGRADGYLSPIDWRGPESSTDIPRRSVSPCRWPKRRGRPSLGSGVTGLLEAP
jgi:hypothetical protein